MPRQSKGQKKTIRRVMREYKHGELPAGRRRGKVKSRRQAVAIALSEAGASRKKTPKQNKQTLRKTKTKERPGQTARARTTRAKATRAKTPRRSTARARPTTRTAKARTPRKAR